MVKTLENDQIKLKNIINLWDNLQVCQKMIKIATKCLKLLEEFLEEWPKL